MRFFLLVLVAFCFVFSNAQVLKVYSPPFERFVLNPKPKEFKSEFGARFYLYNKLQLKQTEDWLWFSVGTHSNVEVKVKNSNETLYFIQKNDSINQLRLPRKTKDYQIQFFSAAKYIGQVDVKVVDKKEIQISLIPFTLQSISKEKVEKYLNTYWSRFGIELKVNLENPYKNKLFKNQEFTVSDSTFSVFSAQMRMLRDQYQSETGVKYANQKYFFLVPTISNELPAYIPKQRSIGIVKTSNQDSILARNISKALLVSTSSVYDSFEDLKAVPLYKTELSPINWNELHQNLSHFFYFDDQEHVRANNGMVAYFYWEEYEDGSIKRNTEEHPIWALKRPYKKNYLSYRFNVKYKIFTPFFKLKHFYISIINVLLALLLFLLFFKIRRWIKNYWKRKQYKKRIGRWTIYIGVAALVLYGLYGTLVASNLILDQLKVVSGPLPELKDFSYRFAKKELLLNPALRHKEYTTLASEILIKKGNSWSVKKRSRVLYVDVLSNGKLFFSRNEDTLRLQNGFKDKASNHYIVFTYFSDQKHILKQEVFNHLGIEVTNKLQEENPIKRFLVFVNGYRPTSLGNSFEENFQDILAKGFEHPNSRNFIYDFDRYDYWERWGNINGKFISRFNPDYTFYADGHFSVETSNHRSLVQFTKLSQRYPKRCGNPKKHSCYEVTSQQVRSVFFSKQKTQRLLDLTSNRRGFNLRKQKGRIAGKNLLQLMNTYPNKANNDTLYIVAHSMGFAYAQGMIEVLRGNIHFGTYLIIAPENANAGKVQKAEWKEIWQYGSNMDKKNGDAPCLLDGIAPQVSVKGLTKADRIYIPKQWYQKKGFFESHFIGYYDWILQIPSGKKGYIQQH